MRRPFVIDQRQTRIWFKLLLLFVGVLAVQREVTANPQSSSFIVGVDGAGNGLGKFGHADFWNRDPFYKALADLGVKQFGVHFYLYEDSTRTLAQIKEIDAAMRRHGLTYQLNLEQANFVSRVEVTPGVNEFSHPDGTHRWDLRMEWLNPILPTVVSGKPGFNGLIYDECEHMLLSNNKYANSPLANFDQPFLVNTGGMELMAAYEKLAEAATSLRKGHYEGRVPLYTEQVWPDLFHLFARAGWNITPKLLKENFNSVVLSIAMGAALEYSDRTHFSASPDLWNCPDRYPGHSTEALRTALLMGYWIGAETVYVENLDFVGTSTHHPDAVTSGSLINWIDADHYEITPYGKVLRDFTKNYVPTHPRSITWRDYRPRVAIVRLPDGGWGQFDAQPPNGEAASRNRLLGNRKHPLDEPAREWLHVWPLLTHGAVKDGAISMNNPYVYPDPTVERFVPLDSVAVFDHTVTGPVLDSVECFIVCGHALSAQTFQAVAGRVKQGATCIIARRLYKQYCQTPLPGDWLVVDSFTDPAIAAKLKPYLGPPDVARWRFKDSMVEFHKGQKRDQVTVRIVQKVHKQFSQN